MTEPARAAVAVRDLEVLYQRGGEPAVSGLTFELGPGEGVLVTGGEGSGKTSVLRSILGLARFRGEVTVLGGEPGAAAVARRIGYGPQGRGFLEGHSARQVVRLVAAIRSGSRTDSAAEAAMERAGIPPSRRGVRAMDLEESRRVALACAIVHDPDVLILDDPWEFPETVTQIRAARERGAAIVAATHLPGGFPDHLGRTIELPGGTDL